MKYIRRPFSEAAPYGAAAVAIVHPLLGIVAALALAGSRVETRAALRPAGVAFALAAITLVAAIACGASSLTDTAVRSLVGVALEVLTFVALLRALRVLAQFADFGHFPLWNRASVVCICALAVVSAAFTVARLASTDDVFGDGTVILMLSSVRATVASHLVNLAVILDALLGSFMAFEIARRRGLRFPASVFLGVAWGLAGGRIAQQTSMFVPTFIVPLSLAYWRTLGAAQLVFASIVIACLSRELWLASAIVVVADALSSAGDRKSCAPLKVAALVGGFSAIFVPQTLFHSPSYLIGPTADGVVTANGGDGAYPWEWLFPSPVSNVLSGVTLALRGASSHMGNIYAQSVAAGWGVLFLVTVSMFHAIMGDARLRRFASIAVLCAIVAALPSHAFGVPIPDAQLLFLVVHGHSSQGAIAGLSGLLALCLAAAEELNLLIEESTPLSLVAYPCLLLFLAEAGLSPAVSWRPADTSLAHEIKVASDDCRSEIGFYPGIQGDDPIPRTNRLIAAFTFDEERRAQPSLAQINATTPRQQFPCLVIDWSAAGQYLTERGAAFSRLPPEFEMSSPGLGLASDRDVHGYSIVSLDRDVVFYAKTPR